MSEKQERRSFDERHSAKGIEIIALTGQSTGGAGKAGGAVLWTPSADVLGYVDETGSTVLAEGRLSWLATDAQRGSWIHDLKPLTQYVVRVRRAAPDAAQYAKYGLPVPDLSHHFALDEVIERDVHVAALDERLARWLEPVSLSTAVGDFELDRSLGWFSGVVRWGDREVSVTLGIDEESSEGRETCDGALARLYEFLEVGSSVDLRWRAFAASKLTESANAWQQDESEQSAAGPITPDVFAHRIRLSELTIQADGSSTSYYDDDGLFFDHVILVEVEADGMLSDAYIAG